MPVALFSLAASVALFAGVLIAWEIGRRTALRSRALAPEIKGVGAVEGAVFGLMGLLLAFTFSGAMSRWDVRRALVVEEANDIGTAWLRLDLVPAPAQPALRELFRQYLDSRIEAYRRLPDLTAAYAELARGEALQKEIWTRAVAACSTREGERARLLLLQALNSMIDITTTRTMAAKMHPPGVVYALLSAFVVASALLAGAATAGPERRWGYLLCFALATSISLYTILDLEYPRLGLIRVDAVDQVLVDLRGSMN